MVFTDWVKKNMMESPSILTKKDFEYFDKLVWHDKGKTLNSVIYNPENITLFFDKGFIVFSIYHSDIDYSSNDILCNILCFFKTKDSKLQRKEIVDNFWHFLRANNCTKVRMYTKLNPEFWIKNYDFKLMRYEMELIL